MIPVSSNQVAKKTIPTSSNTFSVKSTSKSSNSMTKKTFQTPLTVWEGTNLSDAGLGDDLYSPSPFGVNEAGGFSHFQNVNQPEINHD